MPDDTELGSFTATWELSDNEGLTSLQVEKQVRMRNVLNAMRPPDVFLLFERYVHGRSLDAIADTLEVTRQAVLKRLATAESNFKVAFTTHWLDPCSEQSIERQQDKLRYGQGQDIWEP